MRLVSIGELDDGLDYYKLFSSIGSSGNRVDRFHGLNELRMFKVVFAAIGVAS